MSYIREIPRDLFNEAKLLKCLGKLYIEAERTKSVKIEFIAHGDERFDVQQNEGDGSIFVANIEVSVAGHEVQVYTGLNSRDEWPLWAAFEDREPVKVFDDHGRFTADFLSIAD